MLRSTRRCTYCSQYYYDYGDGNCSCGCDGLAHWQLWEDIFIFFISIINSSGYLYVLIETAYCRAPYDNIEVNSVRAFSG